MAPRGDPRSSVESDFEQDVEQDLARAEEARVPQIPPFVTRAPWAEEAKESHTRGHDYAPSRF